MKDLTIQDLENFTKEDFTAIKSISTILYDKTVFPEVNSNNCVKYMYITYQDGFIERFATVAGELETGTAAVSMFLGKFQSYKEPLVKGVNFETLTVSSKNPDVQNRIAYLEEKYNAQQVEEEKEDDTVVAAAVVPGKGTSTAKKVAIGVGGVAVGAALAAGGIALSNHISEKNATDTTSTTVNPDENEVNLDLEGKDFIYYRNDKNIPDSLQKQAVLNDEDSMYKLLLKTNDVYTTKDGQTISTGYTFRQMFYANMYFNSTYYSNEQLLSILGDYDFNGGALDENGNLKEGLANEIEDFTIATMAIGIDNPEKLETVISLIKDEEAKEKALEGLPLFVDYINAIKNDKGIKAARKAYQEWIHDSFINDVYTDSADERKYESMDISSHPALQFLLNAEASVVSYMGYPLEGNMGEILVTGEDGVQSLTNTACQTLADRLESFYKERDTLRVIDAQYDSQNATTMQMQEILNIVKADRKFKDLNIDFDILESDYDKLTEYTCDVDQIIRIVSERLQKLNLEPTDKEQELYFGELMADIVNSKLEKLEGYKSGNKTTSTTNKTTTTVITDQNGTPEEKQQQAIEQTSPEAVQEAQNKENEQEGILGSVVTPEEEKITEDKAQDEAENIQQQDQQNYDNIFGIAYAHYSVNGPTSAPADEASYLNNNNYIGNTGNVTVAMAYQQGKDAGIADYYAKHPENNNFGGEEKIDEDIKDYVDPDSISTDPGNSNGQTIEDIINQFNNEDPNKDNVVPEAVNETPDVEPEVTPAPEQPAETPTPSEPENNEIPSSSEDLSKPNLDEIAPNGNVVGGVVDDSTIDGLQENPDGTYGGEVVVSPTVEDFIQTSSAPAQTVTTAAVEDAATTVALENTANLVTPEVTVTDNSVVNPTGDGEYVILSDEANTTGGLDQIWSDLAAYVDFDSISTDEYYAVSDGDSYTKTR